MILPTLPWVVVLALATYRVTRLVTADSITAPARSVLYGWAWDDENLIVDDVTGEVKPTPRGGLRTWVYELLTCPHCFGVWAAIAAYSAWRWGGDVALVVLAVAAVAGIQSIAVSALPDDSVDEKD